MGLFSCYVLQLYTLVLPRGYDSAKSPFAVPHD
jgi:hypothetical protein